MNKRKQHTPSPSPSSDDDEMNISDTDTDDNNNNYGTMVSKSGRLNHSRNGLQQEPIWPDKTLKTRMELWKQQVLSDKMDPRETLQSLTLKFYNQVRYNERDPGASWLTPSASHNLQTLTNEKKWIMKNVLQPTFDEALENDLQRLSVKGGKSKKRCKCAKRKQRKTRRRAV